MSDDTQLTFLGEEPLVRKKYKDRGAKPPQTYDNISEGDNTKYISFVLEAAKLPKLDLSDPDALWDRILWYFDHCASNDMRPTVNGLSSAIGTSRKSLWRWQQGIDRPQNFEVINRAYNMLEELWEMYMLHGKVNPANAIFLGKNHFGYKDVQDVVVTPNNPLGEGKSADEIANQYDYLLTDEDDDE